MLRMRLLAALATAIPVIISAQTPAGFQKVTTVEGFTEYRMNNGLRVLLFPDASRQTLTVNLTYLVGSRHENYGETGMAHLLEHMLFKGTPTNPDIPKQLNEHGANFNASTSYDRTNYFETVPAGDANLKWALNLEADRMVHSNVAKKDLDSEMTVVRNEFEMGENSPMRVLQERVLATAYIWHNYGKTTIGARSDIENVPIERLQAFYRTYYQPDNAVLLIAGQFDEKKALELTAQTFGIIPKPSRELPKAYTVEPVQDGERTVTLRRTGDNQLVAAVYHLPQGASPDFAALDVMAEVLGASPGGRLHKALVESKKATMSGAYAEEMRDPGFLYCVATLRSTDSIDEVRKLMLDTVEGLAKEPPSKEEVERARTALLSHFEQTLTHGDRIGLEMSEWIASGDWRLFFLQRDRIKKVTPEEVQRVAAKYIKESNRTLGEFIPTAKPDRAEIPAVSDVNAMVKDYKGSETVAAGEAFDPSPANVEARTTRATIPGGMRLALLPKKTRGGTVAASMVLRLGDEKSLEGRAAAALFVPNMLNRGADGRTYQQIREELDKLKSTVRIMGDVATVRVSIETTRENLPAVLRLTGAMLRKPTFPESEFEQVQKAAIAGIERNRTEPTFIALRAIQRHLSPYGPNHPGYVPEVEEELARAKSATLADTKKFYAEFYGAQKASMAVVGDFDAKETQKLITDLFGNWKSERPAARLTELYKAAPGLSKSFNTPDKANAIYIAAMNVKVGQRDPDFPALELANYIFGGGALNSRLADRIRQKDGLSYSVGSTIHVDPLDPAGSFMAFAICNPSNLAKLDVAFKDEIAKALKDGFTPAEVAAAKKAWLQTRQVSRAQDRTLANQLAAYFDYNRTLAWDAELENKVAALTPDDLAAAMRRHISAANLTIFEAGDLSKTGALTTK
jgi:zinc protease